MPHLLHIDASAMAEGSVSREIAQTFRDQWDGGVTYRDLGQTPIPHLDAAGITSWFTPAESWSAEQAADAALQDELIDELLAADAYLFAVPMYNWGTPSTFKAWLDHVIQPSRTTGPDGPVSGRPATLVLSKGGGYGPGAPKEGWDYVEPYLTRILSEVFRFDLHVITAELTLADRKPELADLRGVAAENRERAHTAARARARHLSGRRQPAGA
ncbi:NAD(P)H-dependent oxidoreductase [Streptosporangiaceae bacterium NEAU-GS5]|nr:NAD(P)H-dependent oxidoreductase [Streptosporangiaceae bacterium NEAU-GS5]